MPSGSWPSPGAVVTVACWWWSRAWPAPCSATPRSQQVPAEAWGDTCLLLPPSLSECTYSGLFSTMPLPSDGHLSLSEVLADFPVNLLYRLAQEDTP